MIEEAKLTYSPLGKLFEKEKRTTQEQGKKQVEVLQFLKPNEQQIQVYQLHTKLIEDIFPKGLLNKNLKRNYSTSSKKNKKLIEIELKELLKEF